MKTDLRGRTAFYKMYFKAGREGGPRTLWVRCKIEKIHWSGLDDPNLDAENTPVTVVGVDDDKGIEYKKKLKELIIADE